MSGIALMETSDIKTEWEKPNKNPLEGLSQHDINKILAHRTELLMEVSKHYVAFTEAIYKLPIHVIFRQHAFLFLDTADSWVKRGIDNVWELPEANNEAAPQEDGA